MAWRPHRVAGHEAVHDCVPCARSRIRAQGEDTPEVLPPRGSAFKRRGELTHRYQRDSDTSTRPTHAHRSVDNNGTMTCDFFTCSKHGRLSCQSRRLPQSSNQHQTRRGSMPGHFAHATKSSNALAEDSHEFARTLVARSGDGALPGWLWKPHRSREAADVHAVG